MDASGFRQEIIYQKVVRSRRDAPIRAAIVRLRSRFCAILGRVYTTNIGNMGKNLGKTGRLQPIQNCLNFQNTGDYGLPIFTKTHSGLSSLKLDVE
jgi:hypothetical protein